MKEKIMPLSRKDREANPNIIFQMRTSSPEDIILCRTTFEVLKIHGFPIVMDYKSGKRKVPVEITIRTNSTERKKQASLSVLFSGLQGATRNEMQDQDSESQEEEFESIALQTSTRIMSNFVESLGREGIEVFEEYYSGLRWRTDQEKLLRLLFESGTDFDPSLLEANLSGSVLMSVARQLGFEYDYDWYHADPSHILKNNPDIDYRKLQNNEFAESQDGQSLQRAYAHALGQELAEEFKRYPRTITEDGHVVVRPLIPL